MIGPNKSLKGMRGAKYSRIKATKSNRAKIIKGRKRLGWFLKARQVELYAFPTVDSPGFWVLIEKVYHLKGFCQG